MSPRLNEADYVRAQYKTEENLRARKAAYATAEGDDPREFAFEAVVAVAPRRVLEVGGGEGELAERIVTELEAEVIGIDQSERMVEIQRAKGIDARVGDVQNLPFADADFDVALAAWMLFHVPDLDSGLAELARVLKPGGRLVAVTNALDHLQELWELAGQPTTLHRSVFRAENAEEALGKHFARIERRDAHGWTTMNTDTIRRFAESSANLSSLARVSERSEPLRVRRHNAVFVATKAA
jgi:ubiquinone/menaquinone biosynthesis C-methylase UbiE